jgi:HNH endonuclease
MRTLWWDIWEWRVALPYKDLTAEQQGLHRGLIDLVISEDDGVPFDPIRFRKLIPATEDEWTRSWPAVSQFWELRDGRLYLGREARQYVRRGRWMSDLPGHRRHIPLEIQRTVRTRDQVCQVCGATQLLEFDHIVRVREGGLDTVENLRLLCKPCNVKRG